MFKNKVERLLHFTHFTGIGYIWKVYTLFSTVLFSHVFAFMMGKISQMIEDCKTATGIRELHLCFGTFIHLVLKII